MILAVPCPFPPKVYVEALSVCGPPLLMSILPGLLALPALIVLCPLAENSPTSDCGVPAEESPEKLNEYMPAKPPLPKTEASCESISPLPTSSAAEVLGLLNSMICTCWGETTAMSKKAVAPAALQAVLIFSQNCMVPRPSGPM